MVKLVCRRKSTPNIVLSIWDAIGKVREQKQIANTHRIASYLQRVVGIDPGSISELLSDAVDDGLVVKTHRLNKNKQESTSSRNSIEQDGFWILGGECERDEHDWYCATCHLSGEVLLCDTCPRVYHTHCSNPSNPNDQAWICPHCTEVQLPSTIQKKELNMLLSYVVARLMDKTQTLHNYNYEIPEDDENLFKSLVYQAMDLTMITRKATRQLYFSKPEFYGDVKLILHNCIIYFGAGSEQANLAGLVLHECQRELNEIQLCKDCYYWSNNKKQRDWFCQPCRPPHELVWARLKGFGYWPAKVILRLEFQTDVRFFGRFHERAWINRANVRPITTSLIGLSLKRSTGWKTACAELKKHQQLLKIKGVNYAEIASHSVKRQPYDSDDDTVYNKFRPINEKETKKKPTANISLDTPSNSRQNSVQFGAVVPQTKHNKKTKDLQSSKGTPAQQRVRARVLKRSYTSDSQEEYLKKVSIAWVETEEKSQKVTPSRGGRKTPAVLPSPSKSKSPTKKTVRGPKQHAKRRLKLKNRPQNSSCVAQQPDDGNFHSSETQGSSPWRWSESERGNKSPVYPSVTKCFVSTHVQTDATVCSCGRAVFHLDEQCTGVETETLPLTETDSETNMLNVTGASMSQGLSPTDVNKTQAFYPDEVTGSRGDSCYGPLSETLPSVNDRPTQVNSSTHSVTTDPVYPHSQCRRPLLEGVDITIDDVATHQSAIDRAVNAVREEFEKKLKSLTDEHLHTISRTKRRQWCVNCENEAIYHCCWNNAYCSPKCQRDHWHREHMKSCQRKKFSCDQEQKIAALEQ